MDILVMGLGPFFNASIVLSAIMFLNVVPSWKQEMERLQKQGREVSILPCSTAAKSLRMSATSMTS